MPRHTLRYVKHCAHKRRGSTMVLMVFLIVAVICMTAFSVDLGLMYLDRSQIQSAVDSGAIAATLYLRENPTDYDGAAEKATEFVQRNRVGIQKTVAASAITVNVGTWDEATETFAATTTDPDSVQVQGVQNGEQYWFAPIFGKETFGVVGSAIAKGRGGTLDIMMVLDMSGSMGSQGRIEALQNSAPTFVDVIEGYNGDDQIGVMGLSANPNDYDPIAEGHNGTIYNGNPMNPATHNGGLEADLTTNFDYLRDNILSTSSLTAGKYGNLTGTGAAIRDAAHYLINDANVRDKVKKVIVLMSDGHANMPGGPGGAGPAYAKRQANYAKTHDIVMFTISLGNDADTRLMANLAAITGGTHFDATGSGESQLTTLLTQAFQDAAGAAKRTVLVK